MTQKKIFLSSLVLILLLFITQGLAKNLLNRNNNELSFGLSNLNLNYEEPDKVSYGIPTGYLDREKGTVSGIDIMFSRANKYNFYYELDGSYHRGKLTYDGYTQAFTLASFKSSHQFYTFNSRIGYVIHINNHLQSVPFVTLGYRIWQRNIVSDQRERYKNGFIGLGWKFDWNIVGHLIVSPLVAFGKTIFSSVDISEPPIKTKISLQNNLYCQLGLEINYLLTNSFGFGFYANYLSFDFGGNFNWQEGIYEPDSTTRQFIYGIHLSYFY